ncbi:MAG: biopolymer transporter ExbD [Candidatus Omnitrophica bacterium]|nr:biopolymer transporter ExbD [Candidatus Omnitrophota bacterium]
MAFERPLRRFGRKPLPLAVGMDLSAMIDIVFQQLIFFMLTSAFVFQSGVKIHLPKTVTSDITQKESFSIVVSREGHLYVGPSVVTPQELRARLAQGQRSEQPVLIRADRGAAMGRVVEVWDLCRSLGITQVNIATDTMEHDKPGQTR